MAEVPRLSTADEIIRELKRINKKLIDYAANFPDEDCYATPYSVIADMTRHIQTFVEELKPSIKEAIQYRKENPDQFPNRARRWCVLNDSRRKSRTSSEETSGSDEETP